MTAVVYFDNDQPVGNKWVVASSPQWPDHWNELNQQVTRDMICLEKYMGSAQLPAVQAIDDSEFIKTLFPTAYKSMYREEDGKEEEAEDAPDR